jgi:hypothetical protein
MWLGGERSSAATRDAIKVLFDTVRAALTGRLPPAGGAATPDPAGVRYEWTGFAQRGEHAARSLLALTAHLAAAPLPVVLLGDGWGHCRPRCATWPAGHPICALCCYPGRTRAATSPARHETSG